MCRVMKEVFPVKGEKLHNSILAYVKYMHTRYVYTCIHAYKIHVFFKACLSKLYLDPITL